MIKEIDYKKHLTKRNLFKIVSYISIFILGFQINSFLQRDTIYALTEKSFEIREEESFSYPFKVKKGESFPIKLYNLSEGRIYRIYWAEEEGPLCFSWNLTNPTNSSFSQYILFHLRFYDSGWFGLGTPGINSTYEGDWEPVLAVYLIKI